MSNMSLSPHGCVSGFPQSWINWKYQGILKQCFLGNVIGLHRILYQLDLILYQNYAQNNEQLYHHTNTSSSQQYLNYPNVVLLYIYLDYIFHSHTRLQMQQELHQMDHLLTLSLFVSSHTGFHSTQSFSPFLTVMNFPINTTIQWENMQSRLFCCLFPCKLAVATVCELDR